jgi:ABC-2 type transport system ATP-binding protein
MDEMNSQNETVQPDTAEQMQHAQQSPILECRNLVKKYGEKEALNGVNLQINRGGITGLLGPNGSGKTTLIKLASGLLTPTNGEILINGMKPGPETKAVVSYLPERTYLSDWMKVKDIVKYFADFYIDFDGARAYDMLQKLGIGAEDRLKNMSKGTREKVQLIMVMSRRAQLYILDEPIAGVDPAARDYIMHTILTNYDPNAAIIISTHLISDIESILDNVVFLQYGTVRMCGPAEDIRAKEGKSIDSLFREVFRC